MVVCFQELVNFTHFKFIYLEWFSLFPCYPFSDCRDSPHFILNVGNLCLIPFFVLQKLFNFTDLLKKSTFILMILSIILTFSILLISAPHYFFPSASNPSHTSPKIKERTRSNLFYKVSITLIPIEILREKDYRPFDQHRYKNPLQILANWIQQKIRRIIPYDQAGFIPGMQGSKYTNQ